MNTVPPFPVFRCPQGISKPHSCPFLHVISMLSHLFFCLPLLLAPFTVPCRIIFAMPEDLEMWLYHLSFRFFTMVRRSSCTPTAFWIQLWHGRHMVFVGNVQRSPIGDMWVSFRACYTPRKEKFGRYPELWTFLVGLETHVVLSYLWSVFCK